tara:strand:- start:17961 stop:18413 length:453 start_codon:yes stop_codon:yes gene_type:complete
MAMESLNSSNMKFYNWGEQPKDYSGKSIYLPEGKTIKGYYQESKEKTFDNGDTVISHFFHDKETEEGFACRGNAYLNTIISNNVSKGELVQLTYKGKQLSPKTKRTGHFFEILRDKEDIFIYSKDAESGTDTTETSPATAPDFTADEIPF